MMLDNLWAQGVQIGQRKIKRGCSGPICISRVIVLGAVELSALSNGNHYIIIWLLFQNRIIYLTCKKWKYILKKHLNLAEIVLIA